MIKKNRKHKTQSTENFVIFISDKDLRYRIYTYQILVYSKKSSNNPFFLMSKRLKWGGHRNGSVGKVPVLEVEEPGLRFSPYNVKAGYGS